MRGSWTSPGFYRSVYSQRNLCRVYKIVSVTFQQQHWTAQAMKNNQRDREEPDSGQSKDNPLVFGKRWVCPQAGDGFIIHGTLVGKLKSLILWFRAFDVSSDSTAVTPETDSVQLDSNFSSRCMANPAGVNDVMLLMRGISFLYFGVSMIFSQSSEQTLCVLLSALFSMYSSLQKM